MLPLPADDFFAPPVAWVSVTVSVAPRSAHRSVTQLTSPAAPPPPPESFADE
jgi:hypothetical protein